MISAPGLCGKGTGRQSSPHIACSLGPCSEGRRCRQGLNSHGPIGLQLLDPRSVLVHVVYIYIERERETLREHDFQVQGPVLFRHFRYLRRAWDTLERDAMIRVDGLALEGCSLAGWLCGLVRNIGLAFSFQHKGTRKTTGI